MTLTRGMDTDGGRACARDLHDGSQRMLELAARIDEVFASLDWDGPDAEAARQQWSGQDRRTLISTSVQLAHFGQALAQEAAAQDDVSSDGASAGAAASSWLDRRIDAALAAAGRTADATLTLGGKLWDLISGKRDHTVAELVAQTLVVAGSAVGTLVNAATGEDAHWLDESDGHVGRPVPVPTDPREAGPHRPTLVPPTDVPSLMRSVTDAYDVGTGPGSTGDVRITTVTNADGQVGYVVSIPGTEAWGVSATGYVRDTTGNLHLVAGGPTAAANTVRQAMDAAGIPPGANVMLVGHSQGGIIAGTLASDPDFVGNYNVTHVLAYASPVDHLPVDSRVRLLEVEHRLDVVPKLDFGGEGMWRTGPGQPTVVLPSPGWDPVTNHNHLLYIDSVRTAMGNGSAQGQVIADYQNDPSLLPYLVGPGDSATAVDVPIDRGGRRNGGR